MVFDRRRGVLLAAAVLALLGGLVLTRAGSSGHPRRPAARPTVITVEADSPERAVPFGFLGLSLEYPTVQKYAGADPNALDPVFEQLIRNLAPGQAPVLRIGGDSADRTWWPTARLARPPGIRFSITKRWLEVTRALARALRARLILDLNLEAGSAALAGSEARGLQNGIGRGAIRAFELGNEPDLYGTFPWYRTPSGRHVTGRPPGYDMAGLIDDYTRFAAALSGHTLAGPSLGARGWSAQLGRFLAAEPRVRLVTLHRYPLQVCYTPRSSDRYPTVGRLLSAEASLGLAQSFAPYVGIARARHLPVRIDELNTISCGADRRVSQTFASALWALNTLFAMLRTGVHGVNIHTFPGAGYELFRLRRADGIWRATVSPEYYGLMLFARAAPAGSSLVAVQTRDARSPRTWATRAQDGTVRVLMVNSGRRARRVAVEVPGQRLGRARLERLAAPSVGSTTGVTLAGQSFGTTTLTGRIAGRPTDTTIPRVGGRYALRVPGGAAAMLVLSPPATARG